MPEVLVVTHDATELLFRRMVITMLRNWISSNLLTGFEKCCVEVFNFAQAGVSLPLLDQLCVFHSNDLLGIEHVSYLISLHDAVTWPLPVVEHQDLNRWNCLFFVSYPCHQSPLSGHGCVVLFRVKSQLIETSSDATSRIRRFRWSEKTPRR